MKVKDFLEWFSDFDPQSELKFELFEEGIVNYGDYKEFHTELNFTDIKSVDGNCEITFELGEVKEWIIRKIIMN